MNPNFQHFYPTKRHLVVTNLENAKPNKHIWHINSWNKQHREIFNKVVENLLEPEKGLQELQLEWKKLSPTWNVWISDSEREPEREWTWTYWSVDNRGSWILTACLRFRRNSHASGITVEICRKSRILLILIQFWWPLKHYDEHYK